MEPRLIGDGNPAPRRVVLRMPLPPVPPIREAFVTRRRRASAFFLLPLLAWASTAQAQSPVPEAVQSGYRLMYNGDRNGAVRHFDEQLRARPDDLPLRYGWLVAERGRLGDAARRPAFETALDAFISAAEKRHNKKSDQDSEALFYMANAFMMRAQYRFDYDKGMFGAARDGKTAKQHIEQYIKRHPDHADAYLVLGMYNYFVDIAPAIVHMVRFFLFLPGGDRVEGLRQIERVAAQGALFGPMTRSILMDIYSRYEGRAPDAAAAGEFLRKQFPDNDEIAFKLANVYLGPLEDRARAAGVYQSLIDRRKDDKTLEEAATHYNAILGLAGVRQEEWRTDDAIATITPVIDAKVAVPDWVVPQFLIRRSNYKMLLNDPKAADDAKRVLSEGHWGAWHEAATNMVKLIDERRASGEAATVAALAPGNRLVAEGKWDEAARAYEPVKARDPQNLIVRYRLAYLDFLRGRPDAALPAFSAVASNSTKSVSQATSDAIRSQSLLYVGRIHDLAGRRGEAKKAYQKVVDDFRSQRAASAARIGLVTPYQRQTTISAGR
jgi:tetratricopeptide (TPR) repeat protein